MLLPLGLMAWKMLIQPVRTSSGNIYLIKYATSVFPRVGNPDEHNWWWLANQTKERAQWENVLSLVETSVSCYCGIPGPTQTNPPLCLNWNAVCTAEWLWMLTPFLWNIPKTILGIFLYFLYLHYWQIVEEQDVIGNKGNVCNKGCRLYASDIWSQRWVVCHLHCVGNSWYLVQTPHTLKDQLIRFRSSMWTS